LLTGVFTEYGINNGIVSRETGGREKIDLTKYNFRVIFY